MLPRTALKVFFFKLNMKISLYKQIKDVVPFKDFDVLEFLELVKSGKWSKEIMSLRLETDKEKKSILKSKLPYVTIGGTFSSRSNSGLKKHSGLLCLDFDKVEDLTFLVEQINKDKYTYCSFISPSGDGLKVIVKIPFIDNDSDYKDYYFEVQKYYKKYSKSDIATTDLARATFVSYDPYIFINENAQLFSDKFNRKVETNFTKAIIPITDSNEIAERLMVWFRKRYFGLNRNTNLHNLARQFNAFGVDKNVCLNYLIPYEQPDFKAKEIELLINSAYKYTSEYNSVSFENNKKLKEVEKLVRQGQSIEYIANVTNVDASIVFNESKKIEVYDFWTYDKNGNPIIDFYRYKNFLKANNIFKIFTNEDSDGFAFIKKEDNFIDYIERAQVKDFTLQYLEKNNFIDVYNIMALRPMFFSKDGLSAADTAHFIIQKDKKEYGIIYYKNKAVKVFEDKFELHDYDDLTGFVWKSRVVDRNIELTDESEGVFKRFIWLISGESPERYYTIKSVLGYLMHSYKDNKEAKAIVFNDEMISDVPNGGSGKGLLNYAISCIKKMGSIDGKSFSNNNQFKFAKIPMDAQVVHFDDVKKSFDFEDLFVLITGEFEIEKKGKDPFVLTFENSPKLTITTNYTVKSNGGSFDRRMFEVELSTYFSSKYSPFDEFGHSLFDDWNDLEWSKFDNYMLRCLQYFLKNGLVKYDTINLEIKKLINDTNKDFIDFMEDVDFSKRYYKTELKDLFSSEYEDYKNSKWFTTNVFNKWIDKYCNHFKFEIEKGKTNGMRYIVITKTTITNEPPF